MPQVIGFVTVVPATPIDNAMKLLLKDFILRSNEKHNNKYIYTDSIYLNNKTKIEIICPIHGSFFQRPAAHLEGQGCKQCFIIKTYNDQVKNINWFIEKSNNIHNHKYDYSQSIYTRAKDKIKIICLKHGLFIQSATAHLKGQGCPSCKCIGVSSLETEWINTLNNGNIFRQFKIIVGNSYYKVDGYDPITNTIYEFYGDYWHGNPKVFNLSDFNLVKNKTFQELYDDTINKEIKLMDAGYNLISIWENDYINQ